MAYSAKTWATMGIVVFVALLVGGILTYYILQQVDTTKST